MGWINDSAGWKEVIPHRTDVLLEGIDVFLDRIVITERKTGLSSSENSHQVKIIIDFGEPVYDALATLNLIQTSQV